jgi:hypothetical protein
VRTSDPPAELVTFDPAEWPGTPAEGHAAWRAARERWHAEHGWPGGDVGWAAAQVVAQTPDDPWDPELI